MTDLLAQLVWGLFAIGVLTFACWWVFSTRGVRRVNHRPDYGLLSPVLRTDTESQAEIARDQLLAAGMRATVAPAGLGFTASGHAWPASAHMVLVFPGDIDAAEALLRPTPSR